MLHNTNVVVIPFSYFEAIKHPHWHKAMKEELSALHKQETWELVPCPPTTSMLGSRWVFKLKLNSDGSIARYKARLITQGNREEYGIDYDDTFSPVAKMLIVRIFLIIDAHYKWSVHQLDVSNVFLHGTLDTTVYMKQPLGFGDSTHSKHVCLLRKAIYGLKQTPL